MTMKQIFLLVALPITITMLVMLALGGCARKHDPAMQVRAFERVQELHRAERSAFNTAQMRRIDAAIARH